MSWCPRQIPRVRVADEVEFLREPRELVAVGDVHGPAERDHAGDAIEVARERAAAAAHGQVEAADVGAVGVVAENGRQTTEAAGIMLEDKNGHAARIGTAIGDFMGREEQPSQPFNLPIYSGGISIPRSRCATSHSCAASRMLAIASSRVSPSEMQPGIDGTIAVNPPSSAVMRIN